MIKRSPQNPYKIAQQNDRDDLCVAYLPAVRAMAYRIKERIPSFIDTNDLISVATIELLKLARRYDENINDSFWNFAKTRVNGAIMDYLRSLDVLSRQNRKILKAIDREITAYFNEHDEEPDDDFLSARLQMPVEKIREARLCSDISAVLPLDENLCSDELDPENGIETVMQKNQVMQKIEGILRAEKPRNALIMQLYFFEELNLSEIKEIVGVSEGRVSQIIKHVIKNIRQELGVDPKKKAKNV